jgi:exodeoxyribonuclease V alpha subunit
MTVDVHDGRRSIAGEGSMRAFADATLLDAADVRTALALGRVAGGADDEVLLAAALTVRAVRLGHVYVDLATVATTAAPDDEETTADVTALPWPDASTWPALVAASPLTAVGAGAPADRPLRLLGSRLYLDRYWRHERAIAADLRDRSNASAPPVDADALAAGLARLFPSLPTLQPGWDGEGDDDDRQRQAAAIAVRRRLSVVAGGPGTGKTTTVARILALLHEQALALGEPPPRVALAAPTGKAAARLAEAVHAEAANLDVDPAVRAALVNTPALTLHRLLGWQPGNRSRFRHDATNQLPHNVVIVDESSMVSLSMMAKLLDAVRPTARLVLVGDPRQLASVEAGAVLGDIVGPAASGSEGQSRTDAPIGQGIVVLRRIHRFGGAISELAAAIESGDADAVLAALRSDAPDVTWIEADTTLNPTRAPELAAVRRIVVDAATAVAAAARTGDAAGALESLRAVQVLCAHRRGLAGAAAWRFEIERWLRAAIPGYGLGTWFAGRPLLVTENDYALGVFNGDTGVVVDVGGGRLNAVFDRRGEILAVRPTRLASVDSLYAMTIHKAQGSQFGAVVVVLPEPTSPVLTRELLYTAVTRAQAQLTVIGSEAAVRAAVRRPVARASGLAEALWST